MICSFTLNLKPIIIGKKIKRYSNYFSIKKILKDRGIEEEELKKIVVSNFITKDRFYQEKNYSLKISSIDSEVTLKILRVFFLIKLEGEALDISGNKFFLLNTHYTNMNSRQLLIENIEYKDRVEIDFITPCFFKFGSRLITSFEPIYIISNLLSKLKHSSLAGDENFTILRGEISEIKYEILSEKSLEIRDIEIQGLIGRVVYYVEDNEELSRRLNNLLAFAFFSGIGYRTQEGYGQIKATTIKNLE